MRFGQWDLAASGEGYRTDGYINVPTDVRGTVEAIMSLVEQLGGVVVGACFIIELSFLGGRERLAGTDLYALIEY